MHSTLRHAFGLALFMRRGVTTWILKSSHRWRADANVGSALKNRGKGRQISERERERKRRKEGDKETTDGGGDGARQVLIGDYGYVKSESSV